MTPLQAIRFSRIATLPLGQRGSSIALRTPVRCFCNTQYRAAQGYGDGEGDPRGENPQDQGASNATKHNAEHPGPAPPKEGQNTGAGPTKGGGSSPEEASAQSGGSRSKEAKETGSSPTGGSVGGGKNSPGGSRPTIHDESTPGKKNSEERKAEVEQHNKEFEKGHDRAPPAEAG